jgi:hypothetical protein
LTPLPFTLTLIELLCGTLFTCLYLPQHQLLLPAPALLLLLLLLLLSFLTRRTVFVAARLAEHAHPLSLLPLPLLLLLLLLLQALLLLSRLHFSLLPFKPLPLLSLLQVSLLLLLLFEQGLQPSLFLLALPLQRGVPEGRGIRSSHCGLVLALHVRVDTCIICVCVHNMCACVYMCV